VAPASSDPNKPGTQTTEFRVATVVGIIGAIVAGLSVTFAQLRDVFPANGWIVTSIGILAGLGTMLGVANKFIGSRTSLKVAQVSGAAQVQSAQETALGKTMGAP